MQPIFSGSDKSKQSFYNENPVWGNKNNSIDDVKRPINNAGTKSYVVTLILVCIPYTGVFGIHDFYLGKTKLGIIKLFTVNFFGIGWIIDILMVLAKNYTDSYGNKL